MTVDEFVVEERLSAWQKKKVRTIVVNRRLRKSSRSSLAGALAMAKPYERIELSGGEYFETVSIGIPLEIVAAEGEDPCIISRGSCLTITHDVDVYFEHVEFVSKGKSKLESAVALMNGRPIFSRCKMNSVLIGGYARSIFDNCTIAESYNGFGIQICGTGGGEIRNCTVSTHSAACVEIDTKGTVLMRDCTIRQPMNGGHGVSVRATQSLMDARTSADNLACRKVTVTKCRIYVSSEVFRPKDREWAVSDTVIGQPGCVVISRDACPVFSHNEITEGFFGFIFDFAGSAVLEGNCIYKQRNSGILVIVDERNYSFDTRQKNLCISGGNVIDRCFIGIDIQCFNTMAALRKNDQQSLLSQDLPSGRLSFDWFDKLHKSGEKVQLDFMESKFDAQVRINGRSKDINKLKEDLGALATLVCAGHLHQISDVDSKEINHGGGGLEALIGILKDTLKVPLPLSNMEELSSRFFKIRGNKGVDIVKTRFSACELCAIRFENNSYGLVEDCDFVNCGATAIVVNCGAHPLIVGCTFEQSKGAGIFVDNFANPFIMGNLILNSKEHGLLFRNMSRGIVLGNILIGNITSGICVTGGSSTIIASNIIEQGQTNGVIASGGSKPIILMNKFISNAVAHILVTEYSMPFIASNTITSGVGSGFRFESCSGGTVIDNTLTYNSCGITVELDADPYVVSNQILYSLRHGVVIENNGLGTFISNEISFSGNCNIFVLEGGFPVIRNNIIREGRIGGIVILAEGSGTVEHNEINENGVSNVIILDRFTDPIFTKNVISSSTSGCGVICGREASGRFLQNRIFKNKQCGIYVIGKANPQFVKNTISFETIGIIISDSGCGVFRENDIHSSSSFGIIIQSSGDPVIYKNNISKCFLSGLLISIKSSGNVYENNFFENSAGIQLGSTLGTAELDIEVGILTGSRLPHSGIKMNETLKFRKSKFKKDNENKRDLHTLTPTNVHHNKIYLNTKCGVLLENYSYGILEENEIEYNGIFGILADVNYSARRVQEKMEEMFAHSGWKPLHTTEGSGSAIIRKNRICYHKQSNIAILDYGKNNISISFNNVYESPRGIYVTNDTNIHSIEGNDIHDCFDGVYADRGGCGCFGENKIYNCNGTGVYVSSFANPQFNKGNVIERCKVSGIFVDAEGRGVFMESIVRHCLVGVLVYTCPQILPHVGPEGSTQGNFVTSSPTIKQCVIEENALHGVLVITVPSGYPLRQITEEVENSYQMTDKFRIKSEENAFPEFHQNNIRNNRHFGVCHELYGSMEQPEGDQFVISANSSIKHQHLSRHTQSQRHSVRKSSVSQKHNNYQRFSLQGGSEISDVFLTNTHQETRRRRQVSFVENTITNCSIGVVVGGECYSFFLRNKINNNTFFGMLLRFNSKAACYKCEVTDNGIAGLYSVQGALGAFNSGVLHHNNGFCRPDSNPHDPRSFKELPFMQNITVVNNSSFVGDELLQNAFTSVLHQLEWYADIVAEGLYVLCEIVAASSAALSFASGICPNISYDSGGMFVNGLHMDKCDRGWVSDGGIGVWLAQGSMTEVKDNLIEGNRNVGVLYSCNIQRYHHNLLFFLVNPIHGFPTIPGGEVVYGNMRNPRDEQTRYLFFTSTCKHQPQREFGAPFIWPDLNHSFTDKKSLRSSKRSSQGQTSKHIMDAYEDDVPLLHFSANIIGNRITKNGCGITVHLHHALKAHELTNNNVFADGTLQQHEQQQQKQQQQLPNQSKKKKSLQKALNRGRKEIFSPSIPRLVTRNVSLSLNIRKQAEETGDTSSPGNGISSKNLLLSPMINLDELKASVTIERNCVFGNYSVGILCLHVVDVFCGHLGISQLQLEKAANEYNDVSVKITLKKALEQPTLLFNLMSNDREPHHAKLLGNEVYKNFSQQLFVTSRYIAVGQGGIRTMLRLDTLHPPSASMFSSQALVRIPLFASLMMIAPPGMFLLDSNRVCDASGGVYISGFIGESSLCLRNNAFVNISGAGIFLEGHLTCATIGNGNVFEANDVSIRIVMPEKNITQEELNWQQRMGITTRVYSNHFCSPKRTSVIVEGGGAPSPIIVENEFSTHMSGTVACLIQGATACLRLVNNVFVDNYVPVIITNSAGVEGGGDSVTLEGNRFFRNFIGLLVCGGAAPRIVRNIFEEHYRTGLELVGKETKATVEHCAFLSNRQPEGENFSKHLCLYPNNGELRLDGLDLPLVTIVPDNGVSSDEGARIPSGLLVGGEGKSLIDRCMFKGNDIGVDVYSLGEMEIMTESPGVCFVSCLFTENRVAGVWERGVKNSAGLTASSPINLGSTLTEGGETTFNECFFVNNVINAENSGDVVSLDHGSAVFCKSLFAGCIHGKQDGRARFENNTFSGDTESAVYLHKGTRIKLVGNVIRGYRNGVLTFPGAWGHLERNRFLDLTRCVMSAPYCNTFFLQNRMIKAKECGVLAYGGIFSENEICSCLTGVILRNPIEYQEYGSIPTVDKDLFDTLISDNRVHSCEENGILVCGGARIERNCVFCCKTNMNIACSPSKKYGTGIANISKNALFDGDVGLFISNGSEAVIVNNDIFDNNLLGVWVKAGAGGVLQGNTISSALRDGALDVEQGSEVKVRQNAIRNQFSPSYHKTLQPHREKERQSAAKALVEEIKEIDRALVQLVDLCKTTKLAMVSTLGELKKNESRFTNVETQSCAAASSTVFHKVCSYSPKGSVSEPFDMPNVIELPHLNADRKPSISIMKEAKVESRQPSLLTIFNVEKERHDVPIHISPLEKDVVDNT